MTPSDVSVFYHAYSTAEALFYAGLGLFALSLAVRIWIPR